MPRAALKAVCSQSGADGLHLATLSICFLPERGSPVAVPSACVVVPVQSHSHLSGLANFPFNTGIRELGRESLAAFVKQLLMPETNVAVQGTPAQGDVLSRSSSCLLW